LEGKAQKHSMETNSGEFNLGKKFVRNFVNLIDLKLGESVGSSRKRICTRQQINVVNHKTFRV